MVKLTRKKNTKGKKFIGIEFYYENFHYCEKKFSENENIAFINNDFANYDFLKHNADCYFFNHPTSNNEIYLEILKKIINKNDFNKEILLIFVNFEISDLTYLKKAECVENYKIGDRKGYSIYCIKN